MNERALTFECEGVPLVAILHAPASDAPQRRRGVLVVVGGGPQYRVGGHRQLVLWARRLAEAGYPVMRFDYRGMGDSHGTFTGFEAVATDIRTALARLRAERPELTEIVLWGECDAASAILFQAWDEPGVAGAVLLNPWARTEAGQAKTILRHYYLQRLTQPEFWRKLMSLNFNPLTSLRSLVGLLRQSRKHSDGAQAAPAAIAHSKAHPLPERLHDGYARFSGKVMLVLGGRDLIAREFEQQVSSSPAWQATLANKPWERFDLAEGDHTFSSHEQRQQVADWAVQWLGSW